MQGRGAHGAQLAAAAAVATALSAVAQCLSHPEKRYSLQASSTNRPLLMRMKPCQRRARKERCVSLPQTGGDDCAAVLASSRCRPPPSGSSPSPPAAATDLRLILLRVARPGEGEDSGKGCNEQPPTAGALHPGWLAAG